MVVFVPVWERETDPLAFSIVTTILNGFLKFKWISFELYQVERKELFFLLLQKRLWPS